MELMHTTATGAEIEKFHLSINDVVITKDSESWDDIAIPSLVVETAEDLLCGYHLAILRPKPEMLNGRFLFRCLQSKSIRLQLELASTGVTRFGLPKGEIGKMLLPVTSMGEQQTIADYLDKETAQIDTLIKQKEQILSLLAEKRAAFIIRSVTRGLNPGIPLKCSDIPWIGYTPSHWKVRRSKYLFKQVSLPVEEGDEIVTCFRDGQVTLRKNRREEGFTNAVLELGYQGIRSGQLVLHSMDAFAGAIGVSDSDGKCSPEYIICDPIDRKVVNEYYAKLLRVMALRGFILAACPAVRERAPRIRFSNFSSMFLPLPPRNEQEQIVAAITEEREQTAEMEAALHKSISLLKERRSALITAAVTGQLNISGEAA
jgi:type I restriction enzyme S subunit